MKKLLSFVLLSVLILGVAGCGGKVKTQSYSAKDLTDIEVIGTNGNGILSIEANGSLKGAILNEAIERMGDNITEYDKVNLEVLLYSGITYKIDGETRDLSNNDKIEIEFIYSEDFEKFGIKFTDTKFTYTVSGLEEPNFLDIFEDVTIKFTGVSPNAIATVDTSNCSNLVKSSVIFAIDDPFNKLANGDTVVVNATGIKQAAFDAENYIIEETSKSFPVEGLPFYIENPDNYDFSEVEQKLDIRANEELAKFLTVGKKSPSLHILGIEKGNTIENWMVNSKTLVPLSAYFFSHLNMYNSSTTSTNMYVKIYAFRINATKDKKSNTSGTDGYESGATGDFDVIFAAYMSGIVDNGDGTLNLDSAVVKHERYAGNWLHNTPRFETKEQAEHYWIENNPDWNYTKLY